MSTTMATQEGRVQLEQSDIGLALNIANMAKGGFSSAPIEETQYQIKTPCAQVQEREKPAVEFPAHRDVKAARDRHPATVPENATDRWLPCQNGPAQNLQRH